MSDEINQKTRQPSFLSGYGGGQPVYTPIRIVPEELVAIIEEDIWKSVCVNYSKAKLHYENKLS